MKKFPVVLFLLAIVFVVTGCSAFQAPKAVYDGRVLNGNVKNYYVFYNDADQAFGVRAKVSDMPEFSPEYHIVLPGRKKTFTDTSDWDTEFWIIRWDPVANSPLGEEMKMSNFKLNGLFNHEIRVTNLMLSGFSRQIGWMKNSLGYAIDVNLQGQRFTLASGEVKIVEAVSLYPKGAVEVSWRPSDALPSESWYNYQHPVDHDPNDAIVWVDGEPVETGWGLNIYGGHRSWRQRRR